MKQLDPSFLKIYVHLIKMYNYCRRYRRSFMFLFFLFFNPTLNEKSTDIYQESRISKKKSSKTGSNHKTQRFYEEIKNFYKFGPTISVDLENPLESIGVFVVESSRRQKHDIHSHQPIVGSDRVDGTVRIIRPCETNKKRQ